MEENWYALEQHAHDRITEARAIARSQALIQEFAPPQRHPYSLRIGFIHRAGGVLARAVAWRIELSRILANLRAATKRC